MTARILIGDVFEQLATLPDESIDCVFTSPPYWGLRDYGVDGQIGLEPTLGEHLDVMVRLFGEIWRVLKPHGTVFINYGDCYATSPNGRSAADTKATGKDDRTFRDKPFSTVGPIYETQPATRQQGRRRPGKLGKGGENGVDLPGGRVVAGGYLKPKDLCMVPNRLAIKLQEAGWWVRSEIVWAKPNPMPESVIDRPAGAHEKIFLLTKSGQTTGYRARDTWEWSFSPDLTERLPAPTEDNPEATVNRWISFDYFYDTRAVRQGRSGDEDAQGFRGGSYVSGVPGPRAIPGNYRVPAGWDTEPGSHGTIHKTGRAKADSFARKHKAGAGDHGQKAQHRPDRPEVAYLRGHGRNLRNYEPPPMQVWVISTAAFKDAHFATFPPELVERGLKAGCLPGGMVLDPFEIGRAHV